MVAESPLSIAPPTAVPTSGLDLSTLTAGRIVEARVTALAGQMATLASRHGALEVDLGTTRAAVGDVLRFEVRALTGEDGQARLVLTPAPNEDTDAATVAKPAVASDPVQQALGRAVARAVATQSGLAPLYATLAGLAASAPDGVPDAVRALVGRLMGTRLAASEPPTAQTVANAFRNSGLFAESSATNSQGAENSGGATNSEGATDLKQTLTALRAELVRWVGGGSPATTGAGAGATQRPSVAGAPGPETAGGASGASGGASANGLAARAAYGASSGAVRTSTGAAEIASGAARMAAAAYGAGPVGSVPGRPIAAAGASPPTGATEGAGSSATSATRPATTDGATATPFGRDAGSLEAGAGGASRVSASLAPATSTPASAMPVSATPDGATPDGATPEGATRAASPTGAFGTAAPSPDGPPQSGAGGATSPSGVGGAVGPTDRPGSGGAAPTGASAAPATSPASASASATPTASTTLSGPTAPSSPGASVVPSGASGAFLPGDSAGSAPSVPSAPNPGGDPRSATPDRATPAASPSATPAGGAGAAASLATPIRTGEPAATTPGVAASTTSAVDASAASAPPGAASSTAPPPNAPTPPVAGRPAPATGGPVPLPNPAYVGASQDPGARRLAGPDVAAMSVEASESLAAAAQVGGPRERSPKAPPPPRKGVPPVAQAALPSETAAGDDVESLGRRALERTEGALQRILLEQYVALDTRGEDTNAGASRGLREWTAELPLATANGTSIVQMTVDRDGAGAGGEREAKSVGWRVRFALDVEPIGPIHAQIGLSGEHLSVGLWIERPDMAARLADDVGQLTAALADGGLTVEPVRVKSGSPPVGRDETGSPSGHFIDVSL